MRDALLRKTVQNPIFIIFTVGIIEKNAHLMTAIHLKHHFVVYDHYYFLPMRLFDRQIFIFLFDGGYSIYIYL